MTNNYTPAPNPRPPTIDPNNHPGVPLADLARLGPIAGRCHAWVKTKARYCLLYPCTGLPVCGSHGATHSARASGKRRAELARAEGRARRALGPVKVDPFEAIAAVLAMSFGEVSYWAPIVAELSLVEAGDARGIIGVNHLGDRAPHVAVVLLGQAQERAAKFSKIAADMGFSAQEARIAQAQSDLFGHAMRAVLAEFGHDVADPEVARRVARHLRALPTGDAIDVEGEEH